MTCPRGESHGRLKDYSAPDLLILRCQTCGLEVYPAYPPKVMKGKKKPHRNKEEQRRDRSAIKRLALQGFSNKDIEDMTGCSAFIVLKEASKARREESLRATTPPVMEEE